MQIIFDEYLELLKGIAQRICDKKMILWTGTGATRGEVTASGCKVLDGAELQEHMIKFIREHDNTSTQIDYSDESFQDICSDYFDLSKKNQELHDKQIEFFKKHFFRVSLDEHSDKYKFFNLNWRNVYTLNIDDTIEQNTKFKNVICPDMRTKYIENEYRQVVKLHGDIRQSILDRDELSNNIVFSKESYLRAINQNSDVLNYFLNEYSQIDSLIFGVSFNFHEEDIEGSILNSQSQYSWTQDTKRFYITSTEPTGRRLKNIEKIGVTDVIVLKNKTYDDFISDLLRLYRSIISTQEEKTEFDMYIAKLHTTEDKKENTSILTAETTIYKIFKETKQFIQPNFIITREIVQTIIESLGTRSITTISGGRLSGKTFILLNLINILRNKNVYFIPTEAVPDTSLFLDFIKTCSADSYIFFDTNSYSDSHLNIIKRHLRTIQEKRMKILLSLDSSDSIKKAFLSDLFYTDSNTEDIINISRKLTNKETELLNEKLNLQVLPKFNPEQDIFTNITNISFELKNGLSTIVDTIEEKEFQLLFYLIAYGKLYTSTLKIIDPDRDIQKIESKFKSFIFLISTDLSETNAHSSEKFVAYCRACLIKILAEYAKKFQSNAIQSCVSLIRTLKSHVGFNLYNKLFLFDSLNDILVVNKQFILELYKELHTVLYDDSHYYLQRTKAVLKFASNNYSECIAAEPYIQKIYIESKHTTSLNFKSSVVFTYALLCARIYNLLDAQDSEKKENILEQSINLYYEAFVQDPYNNKYKRQFFNSPHLINDFNKVSKDGMLKNQYRSKLETINQKKQDLLSEVNNDSIQLF